jgi:hypothetical protein
MHAQSGNFQWADTIISASGTPGHGKPTKGLAVETHQHPLDGTVHGKVPRAQQTSSREIERDLLERYSKWTERMSVQLSMLESRYYSSTMYDIVDTPVRGCSETLGWQDSLLAAAHAKEQVVVARHRTWGRGPAVW